MIPVEGIRALIVGGEGTLGSALARRLAAGGAQVTSLDAGLPRCGYHRLNLEGIGAGLRAVRGDARDAALLRRLLDGQDVVFNLAGLGCHADSMRDPLRDLEMNVRAHAVLLEACRDRRPGARIVFASTRQLYGRPERLPVPEEHPLRPVDINGIHKLAAEQYHLLYHRVYGLRTLALRLTNLMGPRMRIRDARQVFYGAWMRRLLENRPFEVWGGAQRRDVLFVGDAVDALLRAAAGDAWGEAFNIGPGESLTLLELADLFAGLWPGGRYEIRDLPDTQRRIDIGDSCLDIRKARERLGWAPATGAREMIGRTLAFFREFGASYLEPETEGTPA